jgi:hypothetical protein
MLRAGANLGARRRARAKSPKEIGMMRPARETGALSVVARYPE